MCLAPDGPLLGPNCLGLDPHLSWLSSHNLTALCLARPASKHSPQPAPYTPPLSGLFFIGYLAQLPANVACLTFGVRRWLSCILLVWGVVAGLGAAIRTRAHFLVLRFLLGLAEAGTFPAIYFQLARFYDADGLGLAYTWWVDMRGGLRGPPAFRMALQCCSGGRA